ncbi:hypothetical protein I7X12_05540 [Halosimplex litoreum]|uniref:Uncharacterized protein n=1 Tax=Halosimplex litoreum TaxID=1198301 RepID=A0A7T3KWF4_9EURY|nr:hypothetical protein [Halosimplex litoreum]QPV64089.1 hypothetical protein I7X12_05540 [Halosimplex litoreum]
MDARIVAVGLALFVAFAGCLGGPGADAETPEPTDTPAPDRPSTTDTPTTATPDRGTPTPALGGETTTVEYVVRAGELPEGVASANATMAVAFAETNVYHCDGDFGSGGGFGTPTPTPDLDHDLDCLRYGGLTVDLADLNGSRSLGAFSVPRSAVDEYALVVRDVTVTLDDGTVVEDVYAEQFRAHTVRNADSSAYGVEIDLDDRPPGATPRPNPRPHPDSSYEVGSSEFEPETGDSPVRYALSTGGSVADGEMTVRVTRDGAPANVTVTAVGAAEPRYRTGADGIVGVGITSPEIVEFEAAVVDRAS